MNFEQDLRDQILGDLKFNSRDEADLKAMHIIDLLALYYNQRYRLIPAGSRRVHWSAPMRHSQQELTAERKAALDKIEAAFLTGSDLTPYLSCDVAWGYVGQKDSKGRDVPLNQRQHIDLLLSDWGLHHMHLSTEPGPSRLVKYLGRQVHFVKRVGQVVLVKVRPTDAYFVDIIRHPGPNLPPGWAKQHVFRIMATEWPEAALTMAVQGFTGIPNPPSDQERLEIRQAGLVGAVEVAGSVHFPRSLMPTSGMPEPCVEASKHAWQALLWAIAAVREVPDVVAGWLAPGGSRALADLDVHFQIVPDGRPGLVDRRAQVGVPLNVESASFTDGSWGFVEQQSTIAFPNSVVQAAQAAEATS